jgi:hypothetical protein
MHQSYLQKEANMPAPAGAGQGFFQRHERALTHGAELAGLGLLAVPSAQKLRKIHSKETSPEEKRNAKYELGGLGVLAAPSAIHLGHAAWQKLRG